MTTQEFDIEFDILYNNISSNKAPGLNSYEKSSFLTQAEELVVQDIYTGNTEPYSFESNEEASRYLTPLVVTSTKTNIPKDPVGLTDYSYVVDLPDSVWYITYESCKFDNGSSCDNGYMNNPLVVPTKQDDLYNTLNNPFRGPNSSRVLRLHKSNSIELISKYPLKSYTFRYLRRPNPIILSNLEEEFGEGVTINGKSSQMECELPEVLHRPILYKAVELARAAWK